MIEGGLEAVSILAVAHRAGVQRSTVYNHWTDRLSLMLDALEDAAGVQRLDGEREVLDGATPLERVRCLTITLARSLGGDWGTLAASLAAAAERDDTLARAHQVFVQHRRDEVAALLVEAAAGGELSAGIDPQWATALLVGPLYYERLVMHRALSEADASEHIDRVLTLLQRWS